MFTATAFFFDEVQWRIHVEGILCDPFVKINCLAEFTAIEKGNVSGLVFSLISRDFSGLMATALDCIN
jgi:hypothetical protein